MHKDLYSNVKTYESYIILIERKYTPTNHLHTENIKEYIPQEKNH